jgi:phage-related protein
MITTVIFIVSLGLNVALVFATFNLLRKLEAFEQQVEALDKRLNDVYSSLSITLHTMRVIDEKQMFERDDEVGTVFQELVDIVNNLRPLIYGITDERSTNQEETER